MTTTCRACRAQQGELVLDLGKQPRCDVFPGRDTVAADDGVYTLRMWLCGACGLAQLVEDPGYVERPGGVEPAALTLQARAALAQLVAQGLLPRHVSVAEYPSPHGGSWLPLLCERGLRPVMSGESAQIVVDTFGMMHESDQARALAERARRLEPGGTLFLQYHSLATISRYGQWNMLRHNHFGYYSTPVLVDMLASAGLVAEHAWWFDLYGGSILLSARAEGTPDAHLKELIADESAAGVTDPRVLRGLYDSSEKSVRRLRNTINGAVERGQTVAGYAAASRAVALLNLAGVDAASLRAVGDGSASKQGMRMPGTDIPIVSPTELVEVKPDVVLLFLPDLRQEVSESLPELAHRWTLVQ